MKRETVEKANEIIRKLDRQETALKILESPKRTLRFYLKDYYNPEMPCVNYNDIPFQFEEDEIEMLVKHKKKEIEELKKQLENLSDDT